jgi:multidrug efflux system outer membrane protein
MAAANANVGVAKAAFFPAIRINGLAGFQSIDSSTWFDWPSRFWSVGPSVELPLFAGGLNRAKLAAAHAAYNENVAEYRQTMLGAFGEVEDELAAQHLLARKMGFRKRRGSVGAPHASKSRTTAIGLDSSPISTSRRHKPRR